jgi:hypothetical protein
MMIPSNSNRLFIPVHGSGREASKLPGVKVGFDLKIMISNLKFLPDILGPKDTPQSSAQSAIIFSFFP